MNQSQLRLRTEKWHHKNRQMISNMKTSKLSKTQVMKSLLDRPEQHGLEFFHLLLVLLPSLLLPSLEILDHLGDYNCIKASTATSSGRPGSSIASRQTSPGRRSSSIYSWWRRNYRCRGSDVGILARWSWKKGRTAFINDKFLLDQFQWRIIEGVAEFYSASPHEPQQLFNRKREQNKINVLFTQIFSGFVFGSVWCVFFTSTLVFHHPGRLGSCHSATTWKKRIWICWLILEDVMKRDTGGGHGYKNWTPFKLMQEEKNDRKAEQTFLVRLLARSSRGWGLRSGSRRHLRKLGCHRTRTANSPRQIDFGFLRGRWRSLVLVFGLLICN